MALDLNAGDYKIFRDAFKRFLQAEIIPNYPRWEKEGIIPREVWHKAGDNGFLCPWVEEEFGGAGAGFEYSVIITEELARAGTHVMFPLHSDIVVPYIHSYGTPEQKQKWLPGCVSGDIIAAVAMTEPDTGSDLAAIRTTAVRDGDEYVINGAKTFISSGILADLVIVACKTDPGANPPHRGMSLIVVERDTPGFLRGRKLDKMGLQSQDTSELIFTDCRVPAGNILGRENAGFTCLMEKLQQERLVCSVMAQGVAERMLQYTVEYCRDRKIFGRPVASFQHNSFKIVEMATEIELGRTFLYQLVEKHLAGERVVKEVSMAKWWITEMVNRVAYHCLQLHGGYGFCDEYPISRDFRDVRIFNIFAGTTEVMKSIIAKELGL
ncbi:acyl-CoA dehydrogenase [Desulfotomaculum arcticum]|uniref:Acyl-[acyl-carrier-protein] dehydrogenase MbtN n=1 Tax=Desulfotruncus arcticus DSM 17038 TaxID=1121424 RepID=A0A1I2UA51_9FIRM|nr:acyl-CoA dehydrogenase family protein [Desulfotruncus arcticus]SFG71501.1 acyl-CoA dehydrogenase [Desulfotomaculum arcticum] [Desulfotruncus arcticus DSM 17038]